ncbi:MAG: hypothetical protein AVDCRST_MAG56-7674, partial [uncultured Cytophagales bacterium]
WNSKITRRFTYRLPTTSSRTFSSGSGTAG